MEDAFSCWYDGMILQGGTSDGAKEETTGNDCPHVRSNGT